MSKPTVWRWQERYLDEGVPGLKRDKTRPSRGAAASEGDPVEGDHEDRAGGPAERHALESRDDGGGGWDLGVERGAHLGRYRVEAAYRKGLQGLEPPDV